MSTYEEDDYLQLSGIQHFCFCRRQWALIHIEQQWAENLRTVEGEILHERAHDERITEKRGGQLLVRGLAVHSSSLGVSGTCDVVEFHQAPEGVLLFHHKGTWLPVPVEYKRGSPKKSDADRLQLCCQGMCLEEMLSCDIPKGFLFYGESRHREEVVFTEELRNQVKIMLKEMHSYLERRYTPKVRPSKSCNACSLKELCLPKLCGRLSVKSYIESNLLGEES